MNNMFNNYTLSNQEIEKILMDFKCDIKRASKINGKLDEDCEQKIMIAIYMKLSRNRKNNWKIFIKITGFLYFDDIYLVERINQRGRCYEY